MKVKIFNYMLVIDILTLMVLLANLANTKCCKKSEKRPKPCHMGTHLRVLSKSYLMNTNMAVFRWFRKLCVLVLWTKKKFLTESFGCPEGWFLRVCMSK